MPGVTLTWSIHGELAGVGGGWTDLSRDVLETPEPTLEYGVRENGPAALVAPTGTFTFALANGPNNSAGTVGYYSPRHASCRPGFARGIRIRYTVSDGVTTSRWLGYLQEPLPEPGMMGDLSVSCVAVDYIDVLATSPADVPIQVSETEAAIASAILATVATAPAHSTIGSGPDTYAYAMDRQAPTALAAYQDLCLSSRGMVTVRRDATDGQTFVYEPRSTRQILGTPALALDDTVLEAVTLNEAPQRDRIRISTHPRRVVAAGSMAGPVAIEEAVPSTPLAPGATETIWLDYTDPAQRDTRIAATNFATPPMTATTDYTFNAAADGTGADLTADVTVTATCFAESVKVVITNTHATLAAYRTKLQLRADGVYSLSDVTVEATSGTSANPLDLDMPYQGRAAIAQAIAKILLAVDSPIISVEFCGTRDAGTLAAVLGCDVTSVVQLSETVSGATGTFFVNGVGWRLTPGDDLQVTLWVAPSNYPAWQVGRSRLGVNTRPGV